MEIDFSNLNLQYLLQVRDIARKRPELAVAILGLSKERVSVLATITVDGLTKIASVKSPLLTLRGDPDWWSRLFTSLKEPRSGEVEMVLEHAGLAVMVNS